MNEILNALDNYIQEQREKGKYTDYLLMIKQLLIIYTGDIPVWEKLKESRKIINTFKED